MAQLPKHLRGRWQSGGPEAGAYLILGPLGTVGAFTTTNGTAVTGFARLPAPLDMRLHGIHVGWTAKSATTAYSVVVLNGTDTVATVSLPTGSGADSTQAVGASLSNREMTKNTALIVQVIGPATDATITGLNVAVSGHTLDHVNADRAND